MSGSELHILVIGAGSVGKRHMQNLKTLGCTVSTMDPRSDRIQEAGQSIDLMNSFTSIEAIEKCWSDFDGIVIGSPPCFHIDQAILGLKQGKPILMEKPLSTTYEDSSRLAEYLAKHPDRRLLLGYTYRWWYPLREFRARLLDSESGKPLHVKFVMSAHLADWHPWERYQDFFMASKEQGGGALLDESHFIDLMYWFFGIPESVYARIDKLSDLEISSDDSVDILARYPDNLRVSIHLDLYGRPHEKYIRATYENKTLEWSFDPNQIRQSNEMIDGWQVQEFSFERNDMFIEVAREFIEIIRNGSNPSCDISDGLNVMRIIEACRTSSSETEEIIVHPL